MEEFGLGIGQRAIPTSTTAREFGYRFVLSGSIRNVFIFSQHTSTFLYRFCIFIFRFWNYLFLYYIEEEEAKEEKKKQFVSILDYRNTFSHGINGYDFTNLTNIF